MNISEFEQIKESKPVEKEKQRKGGFLKNTTFGVVNGIPQTLLSIPTIIEGVGRAAIGAGQAAFDDDLTLKEGLLKGLTDNKSLQAMGYVDTSLRNLFNIPEYEDADKAQQIEEFTGEMLPIISTGGSYGLINMGRKAAMKAARNAAKKAAIKGLSKEAKKQAIKKAINKTNLGMALMTPGVQITKNAPKVQKGIEIGTQIGLPLTINEITKATAEKPGIIFDYTPPETDENIETLELKPRKNSAKDKIKYVDVDLNQPVESFDDKLKKYLKTGAEIATPIAAIGIARKSKAVQNLLKNYKDTKISRRNAVIFSETLTPGEKVANTIDSKNIIENAYKKGFIADEQTANKLYKNTYTQSNNMFDTGSLYLDDKIFQTDKSPRWALRDFQTIAINNPRETKTFNSFMEKSSRLQNKMYEFNIQNGTDYDLNDFLSKPELMSKINATQDKSLSELYREIQFLYKQVKKDGKFTQILQDISNVNNTLLDIYAETGIFTEKFANSLRRNRDMFGFNTYLPRVPEIEEKGFNKAFETLNDLTKNDPQYKKSRIFNLNHRSEDKSILKAETWDKTFENSFKKALKDALDIQIKKDLVNSLLSSQKSRIEKNLSKIETIKRITDRNNAEKAGEVITKLREKITDDFSNIKYLGEIDEGNLEKIKLNENPLYQILNKPVEALNETEKSINETVSKVNREIYQALRDEKTKAKIIAIPEDNKVKYYMVDDVLGQIVQTNPQNASVIYNILRGTTNLAKQFITGKYNPFFSPITAAYTASDQLVGLKSINKMLNTNVKGSDIGHITGYSEALNYKVTAKKLDNIYKQLEKGKIQRTPETLERIKDLELQLRNSNINQIKATGANLQGRYPIDVYKTKAQNAFDDDTFVVNSPKSFQNLVKTIKNSKLLDNGLIDAGQTGLSYINYALTSLRDAPTLGLYKALNKQLLRGDGKIDSNKIMSISRALDKLTATGNLTPPQTKAGALVQTFNDTMPYFSDMLSENIARIRQTGFGNVANHLINLIDSDVSLKNELNTIAKGIVGNDFVKAGTAFVMVPTVLASIWNHSSPETEAAYDLLPDNYKSKGIVFANVINGKPVVIPLTQSLMWLVTSIREGLADPLLRLDDNEYNRSQNFSEALKDTAKINWSMSMPPLLSAGLNAMGYRSPQASELVGRSFDTPQSLSGLELRNLEKGSNTYYSEGVFGPKTRAMVQTLFGNPGSAVTEAIDIAKSRKSLGQGLEAGINKYTTTLTNLINPKATTWSATSGELYKKKKQLEYARQKQLSPEQQPVLDMINLFSKNKFNPIEQKIKDLRKQVRDIQNTGKTTEGAELGYIEMQKPIEDLIKQIKLLQSSEVKQYEVLDKLLKQQYNTTYNEFMKGIN